jgi:hypothetical protein
MRRSVRLIAASSVFATMAFLSTAHAQGKDPAGVNPAHYQCYRVSEAAPFKPVGVKLKDQFNASDAKILKPVMLCAPTSKNGAAVKDPKTHLVCYEEEGGKAADKLVSVTNQFGTEKLTVGGPTMLCVPSLKTVIKQ